MKFDSGWRSRCSVAPVSIRTVDNFIRAHYLSKRPAITLLTLVALESSTPIGCVVYSAPPRETETRYGGKTWELARLYLLDSIPCNAETWLIGQSVRFIARHHPYVRFLVSYADPSAGHAGTIYKAANWKSDGRTDEGRKTPRCDYVDSATGKKYGRRGNVPAGADIIRVPRGSKFRFVLKLH